MLQESVVVSTSFAQTKLRFCLPLACPTISFCETLFRLLSPFILCIGSECVLVRPSSRQGNMDFQLDHDELEMDQWSHLSKDFRLPKRLAFLRKIPIMGK